MLIKRFLYCVLFLSVSFVATPLFTQNLILNPGFEENSGLPDDISQWFLANDWTNVNGGFIFPDPSPDYLHAQAPGAQVQLPNTIYGTLDAQEGDAVMGFATWFDFQDNFREYIHQEFSEPMEIGNTYEVSFYITSGEVDISDAGGWGIADFGVYFSVNPPGQFESEPILVDPQFSIDTILYNPEWQQVSFQFTADSAYQNITLGNFQEQGATVVQEFVVATFAGAYYMIDNFSLTAQETISITAPDSICLGTTAVLIAEGPDFIGWATAEEPDLIFASADTIEVLPSETITYLAYAQNDTTSQLITVIRPPEVDLGEDQELCIGDSLVLDLSEISGTFNWQDGTEEPTFTVTTAGNYSVTVIDGLCFAEDTIQITEVDCSNCGPFLPNAFSPNGDGTNDSFGVITECTLVEENYRIFNRWGEEVYTGPAPWDGTVDTEPAPADTYIYLVTVTITTPDGDFTETRSGEITLLR